MKKNIFIGIFFLILAIFTGYLLSRNKNLQIGKITNNLKESLKSSKQLNKTTTEKNFVPSIPTEQPVNQGLTIEIIEPKPNNVFKNSQIKVVGKTAALAEVFVNDKETKADSQGNFLVDYGLDEGENLLVISASDKYGNYAEKEIVVNLQTIQ